ncbi:hypothetical protein IWW39_000648 [Coemansia spiralis]|uniref:Uncharacterized protein n=1 Tax=Coemansia spiralis TaxID=417178 RepID=A0A9W8L788_9FUNG|nr:hypothetical protein IWW39_000648 [Coemansia spiralis]
MKARFSADQAAQRLLALIDTPGTGGDASGDKRIANSNRISKAPDASSISWAFHETIDTTGVLRWLSENVDAASNGLADDELELLSYLERTEFQYDDGSNLPKHAPNSTEEEGEGAVPSFELRARKKQAQDRVARLEAYAETVRGQHSLLKGRANQMARELEELQAEELVLTKAASSADGEVARLSSMYSGLLGESSLAAQTLMTRFQPMSQERRYFYQCADDLGRLESALQAHVEDIGEHVGAYLESADELPSPWREFEPFATNSVSELLSLALAEHARIGENAQKLVRDMAALEIENALVRALDAEVDKAMRAPEDLLPRCLALAPSETALGADRMISEHVERLVPTALPDGSAPRLQPAVKSALAHLNQSCNELVQSRSARLNQELETLRASLVMPTQTIGSIRNTLATEGEMLNGWAKLWTTVSSGLERENAEMERQKGELQRISAATRNSQIIHPDDVVALSLKTLVDRLSKACDASMAYSGPAGICGNDDDHRTDTDGDVGMGERDSWIGEGAFTTWEALLADARACRKLELKAQKEVVDEIYALEATERRMNCARLDLETALHGGGPDAGTETIDILPMGVRDMMGELKHQANLLRKRLAEEPGRAAASDYAELFCQYY